jgi:DNA adenine methylase
MGSKRKIANELLTIILAERKPNQYYIEPFCGGLNSLIRSSGKRIGADNCPYLIALWKAVKQGWVPPDNLNENDYYRIKQDRESNPVLTAYLGYFLSFGAQFFAGFARSNRGDPFKWAFNKAKKEFPMIKNSDIEFIHSDYEILNLPKNSIIYCDPPYAKTTKYKNKKFDSEKLWEWCRAKTKEGHKVFISEYEAPNDFEEVWAKQIKKNLSTFTDTKLTTERLFTYF